MGGNGEARVLDAPFSDLLAVLAVLNHDMSVWADGEMRLLPGVLKCVEEEGCGGKDAVAGPRKGLRTGERGYEASSICSRGRECYVLDI
jgi:hypothetical protein